MVKNPPANPGDMGMIPALMILHAAGQLSPWATATEPECSTARVPQQEKPLKREVQAPQLEEGYSQQQRPSAAKN